MFWKHDSFGKDRCKPAGRWYDHERYTTEQHNKQKDYVESTKHELRLYI